MQRRWRAVSTAHTVTDARFEVIIVVSLESSAARVMAMSDRLRGWQCSGAHVAVYAAAAAIPALSALRDFADVQPLEEWRYAATSHSVRLLLSDRLAADAKVPALRWSLIPLGQPSNEWAPAWRAGLPDADNPQHRALLSEFWRFFNAAEWQSDGVAARLRDDARRAGGIGIYGRGMVGRITRARAAAAGIRTLFWVDSNPAARGTNDDGLPVHTPDDAPDGPVVLAAGAADRMFAAWSAARRSSAYGLSTLHLAARVEAEPEQAWQDDAMARPGQYLALMGALDGDASLRVLEGVLHFRRTLNDRELWAVKSSHEQWFDPDYFDAALIRSLVDCGGFDGDTARAFLRHVPDGEVVVIEPDEALAAKAAASLSGARATVIRAAAGAAPGSTWFAKADGMSGALGSADDGVSVEVPVVRVDDCLAGAAQMIKIDVEGQEAAALAGSRETLRHTPFVAIAAYHRAADLTDLPAWLQSHGAGAIGLRHYTGLAYETVAYTTRATPLGEQ